MILEDLSQLDRAMEILDLKEEADDVVPILEELHDELTVHSDLLALSAPQIGHNVRIFALKFEDEIRFFVNPLYVKRNKIFINREKCYSLKNQEYLIPRFEEIEVVYMKTSGHVDQLKFSGVASTLFQQMYDFLEGITPDDYGLPIDDDFDELTDDEKNTIVEQYTQSIKELLENLQDDIKEDDVLRERQHTIDFLTSVAVGETQLAPKKMNREQRRKAQRDAKKISKKLVS